MKIKGSSISLNDIKFHSKIGLYDFEKQEGNDFIVNISVQVDNLRYDDKISSTACRSSSGATSGPCGVFGAM